MGDDVEKIIADARAKLAAQPVDPDFARKLAERRHAAAVAAGVKCPKALNCKICRPD